MEQKILSEILSCKFNTRKSFLKVCLKLPMHNFLINSGSFAEVNLGNYQWLQSFIFL